MSSQKTSLLSQPLPKGTWAAASPADLRSPCPMVNCLANHGYIPRDGRNVRVDQLTSALKEAGLSSTLGAMFSNPIFLEHKDPKVTPVRQRSFLAYLMYLILNPWAILFSAFGMRRPGQKDSAGRKCLDLDQLALHDVIEHDVSLSRGDYGQGDNCGRQKNLVGELLAASSDGGKTLTLADLAVHRRRRIMRQREINPSLNYGAPQNQLGAGEIALILRVLGDGQQVPCEYVRAVFQEERLPIQEGWIRRQWWTLGIFELGLATEIVKRVIGMKF